MHQDEITSKSTKPDQNRTFSNMGREYCKIEPKLANKMPRNPSAVLNHIKNEKFPEPNSAVAIAGEGGAEPKLTIEHSSLSMNRNPNLTFEP